MKKRIIPYIVLGLVVLLGGYAWYLFTADDLGGLQEPVKEAVILHDDQGTITTTEDKTQTTTERYKDKNFLEKLFDTTEYEQVLFDVPFTSQAPLAQWEDPRYQDGCEEASIMMAVAWRDGKSNFTQKEATEIIADLAQFQTSTYGFHRDSSAADTVMFARAYYDLSEEDIFIDTSVTVENIKEYLRTNHVVIVPADGIALENENFTPPGPPNHMLIVVGFDDKHEEFITNDPGTRNGEGYRYPYERFISAIGDYPTGYHEEVTTREKVLIVVSK